MRRKALCLAPRPWPTWKDRTVQVLARASQGKSIRTVMPLPEDTWRRAEMHPMKTFNMMHEEVSVWKRGRVAMFDSFGLGQVKNKSKF